jgi:uncharacterized protein (UPF0333 family)
MEKTIRRIKNPLLLVILSLILVAAIAVGIYFLIENGKDKGNHQGTYVITAVGKEYQS